MNDYFLFGMLMPGRHENSSQYRYGFNGKEKDDETKGQGNSYDFGARIYDPRVGRFLSLDPKMGEFPFQSPYLFAGNAPTIAIDKEGEFAVWTHYYITYKALTSAGIDKATASEIAHYASTYADNPNATVMVLNLALAANYLSDPGRLLYNAEYQPYDKYYSQSDKLVIAVSIHAMRTYWENITPKEAVNRALYGGTFTEKDGTEVRIIGAYEVIDLFKGRDISKLTKEEKKQLGIALHTIQDAEIHEGGRWVDEHQEEAAEMGNESEHPTIYEITTAFGVGDETDKAAAKTEEAISTIQEDEQ
jgi:RHS repeat-associated protein